MSYVYVVTDAPKGKFTLKYNQHGDICPCVKIGKALHPIKRLKDLNKEQSSNGMYRTIILWKTDDSFALETYLHSNLSSFRITHAQKQTEWFSVSPGRIYEQVALYTGTAYAMSPPEISKMYSDMQHLRCSKTLPTLQIMDCEVPQDRKDYIRTRLEQIKGMCPIRVLKLLDGSFKPTKCRKGKEYPQKYTLSDLRYDACQMRFRRNDA